MNDYSSVFVVLPFNIIEICFSRNSLPDSNESNKRMNVSQFLLVAATQFILRVSELKSDWKKWLFFVLTSATGEGFRIDSCRDYPREKFTGINLEKLIVNEYDLIVNIQDNLCSIRIDPIAKDNFLKTIENEKAHIIQSKINKFSLPLNLMGKIRLLDLELIIKRDYFVKPTLDQLQMYLISWNPLTMEEFYKQSEKIEKMNNIDISKLSPLINSEEIASRGWNKYRKASLEQPFGLQCSKCSIIYQANIYAKTCLSCNSKLKRA